MKKFVILFLIISFKCVGQNAISFIDTNVTWNVAKTYPHGDILHPSFIETVTKIYGFSGDTLIGTDIWQKLYVTNDSVFLMSSNLTKSGYLRQNNNLVLYQDTLGIVDTLYNFNIHIGDSIKYSFSGTEYFIKVSSIDSIIVDGSYHKRFFFSELPVSAFDYLHEIWIEGIGSIHGPLFPSRPTTFSTEMPDSLNVTCYKRNDTILWSNLNYQDCFIDIILAVNKWDNTTTLKVFPNPVTTELKIVLPKNRSEEYLISIFDITGRLVLTQSFITTGQLTINTSSLKDSFYILKIVSRVDTFTTNFIKQ